MKCVGWHIIEKSNIKCLTFLYRSHWPQYHNIQWFFAVAKRQQSIDDSITQNWKRLLYFFVLYQLKLWYFLVCNGNVQILNYERWLKWRDRVHYHCSLKTYYFLFASLSKVNINIFLFTIKMDQRELRSLVWYMIK